MKGILSLRSKNRVLTISLFDQIHNNLAFSLSTTLSTFFKHQLFVSTEGKSSARFCHLAAVL